jgi:hypothetical protein
VRRSLVVPGVPARVLGYFTGRVAFRRVLLSGARLLLGGRNAEVKLHPATPSMCVA